MNTSSKHSFSSVLSVNPYKETYFTSISSFISESKAPEFSKDQFVISYLNTKGFITAQIEISKNILDEDLYDAINNKAYDELALDQAVEYKIQYIENYNNFDEENRHFHLFIVDPLELTTTFENVVNKLKYIDTIVPAPLLLKSLYSKEILQSDGVHCFIYIQEHDASLTIYNNKEFIYSKTLKYSYIDMHERFCELYGERIPYEEFMEFIANVHLKDTQSDYKEYVIRLYKELMANINDILTYAKRAFELEKFEHVYVGTETQTVTKLHEMFEVELNIHASEFNFDYGFETNDTLYMDQMHALMQLYTLVPQEDRYRCNFTEYKRPPKFIKRESGKLIILTAVAFALAFAYPITYWTLTYMQHLQVELLKQNFKEVHNLKITREATIKSRLLDKKKALTLLHEEEKEYHEKKNTLVKIRDVKVNYPMKAKLIAKFTKDLNKFNVHLSAINYAENEKTGKVLSLQLVSPNDRSITKLVKYLTKTNEGKYNFNLEKIIFDKKLQTYISELKVTVL
jgi:hypothetical protein